MRVLVKGNGVMFTLATPGLLRALYRLRENREPQTRAAMMVAWDEAATRWLRMGLIAGAQSPGYVSVGVGGLIDALEDVGLLARAGAWEMVAVRRRIPDVDAAIAAAMLVLDELEERECRV